MRFQSPLVFARFLRRYKRFFAEFETDGGQMLLAHCANPGSMKTCLEPGARSWLLECPNPKRKLRYTWQIVEIGRTRIFVNPLAANQLVAEALGAGKIPELSHYSAIKREVCTDGGCRLDFSLKNRTGECFVEVKNVTLGLGEGRAAFPDSVTLRGTSHLRELIRLKGTGKRAVLLFCASRSDALSVEPADEIDKTYGQMLRSAARQGVEIMAYRARITTQSVQLSERIPVRL